VVDSREPRASLGRWKSGTEAANPLIDVARESCAADCRTTGYDLQTKWVVAPGCLVHFINESFVCPRTVGAPLLSEWCGFDRRSAIPPLNDCAYWAPILALRVGSCAPSGFGLE